MNHREVMQQALEALEGELPGWRTPAQERAITALRAALARHHDDVAIANPRGGGVIYKTSAATTDAAIRAKLVELGWTPPTALAQQEQEPSVCARCGGLVYDPVWVAQSDPPRREWVSLTEEEIKHFAWNGFLMGEGLWNEDTEEDLLAFTRAIEQACKERNT